MHACECIMMLDHKWNLYSLLQTWSHTYVPMISTFCCSDGQGVNGL